MNKVYIFDVDGTLTPSRRRMTEDFARFFDEWSKKNTFYLVSGSDLDKIKEQIPIAYLERAEGIFCCGGNKFYLNGGAKLEYLALCAFIHAIFPFLCETTASDGIKELNDCMQNRRKK